jgi:hypothetical protein
MHQQKEVSYAYRHKLSNDDLHAGVDRIHGKFVILPTTQRYAFITA